MTFVGDVGRTATVLFRSVLAFPAVFRSRDSRGDFLLQLYKTGISTLPVVSVVLRG